MEKIESDTIERKRGEIAGFAGELIVEEIARAIKLVHQKIKYEIDRGELSPEIALLLCVEINSWREMKRKLSVVKKAGVAASKRLTPEMEGSKET